MIELAPTSPAVLEWMRLWIERNPDKHARYLKQPLRDSRGRFKKRS